MWVKVLAVARGRDGNSWALGPCDPTGVKPPKESPGRGAALMPQLMRDMTPGAVHIACTSATSSGRSFLTQRAVRCARRAEHPAHRSTRYLASSALSAE